MPFVYRILLLCLIMLPLQAQAAEKTAKILLFGDSITAGYGLGGKDSLPAKLQSYFTQHGDNISVINGGVSGDTTSGGKNRLSWTLKKHKPDLVMIALGGNDALRGIPPELSRRNLEAMLKMAKQAKIPAVLSSVQAPANLGEQYNQAYRTLYPDLAKKYEAPLYPFLLEDTFGNKELMQADGIHPSAAGVDAIVAKLGPFLKDQLK